MDLPENKLTGFIQENEKAKWKPVNNHNITNLTEDDIKRITKNYSTRIGGGAFGQVYQGLLDDGSLVAVKKYINQDFKQGFAKEVTVHCQINHKNVVRLLGYCAEENSLTMVTEFVSRGNLDKLLHDCDDHISLDTRLNIAIQCAEVLSYMHSMMYQPIIHGDIKPANILIDDNFGAKLSDFGISRLLSVDTTQHTTNVVGSRGYVDPEFLESGCIDPKNDVYSFGVVFLELITRKRAFENGKTTDLKRNFIQAIDKGKKVRELFDTEITNVSNWKILDEAGKLAASCLKRNIKDRPEIKNVWASLRILAETNRQHGHEKKGQWSLWGTRKINRENTTTSSSTTSLPKRTWVFNMFNRNAQCNFDRNLIVFSDAMIFTMEELKPILSVGNIIGTSITGVQYYMGPLDDQLVVVKKSYISFDRRPKEQVDRFVNYVVEQSKSTHKNIVKFIGVCMESKIPMLVHEFVPKGNLDDNLHGSSTVPLELDLRLSIAAGSAEGIAYMHSIGATHGDFRPANILLGDNFVPKISSDPFSIKTINIGYVDPVYLSTNLMTVKSDVYSFGVVLLELLTRKKPVSADNGILVLNFLREYAHRGHKGAIELFDTEITERGNLELLSSLAELAAECVNFNVDRRPEMKNVAERLVVMKESRNRHNGV